MEPTKIIESEPGVASSKRVGGLSMLVPGALLLFGLGVYSIFVKAADPATTINCGQALCIVGASLLGVTVLEGLGKKLGGTQ
jgi:hypothetical protein